MAEFLTAANLQDDRIAHGFFTRRGGVSDGIYGSLNCGFGSNDAHDAVAENRRRVAGSLGLPAQSMISSNQIHSAICQPVTQVWQRGAEPKQDAMATDRPGIALGILTADCGPVLFMGEKPDGSPVIGGAHAGWGGAVRGVLESTLDAMRELGAVADTIRAAIGPCIGPDSYEVSAGFESVFLDEDGAARDFFRPAQRQGHLMFDLPGYIAYRLRRAGVRNIVNLARDTCAEEDMFFSYRRGQLRGDADYGREISAIAIR